MKPRNGSLSLGRLRLGFSLFTTPSFSHALTIHISWRSHHRPTSKQTPPIPIRIERRRDHED